MLPAFMTNPFALLYQPYSSRISASSSLIIRVVSTIAWLAGVTAILAGCSSKAVSDSPTPVPTLSSVTAKEIQNYAKAVLSIESSRIAAYNDIQKIINDEKVPDVTCTKVDTIAALPKSIQDIVVNYCNKAKEIGEKQGLTMPQFNAITNSAQTDPKLKQRIQKELLRLQK